MIGCLSLIVGTRRRGSETPHGGCFLAPGRGNPYHSDRSWKGAIEIPHDSDYLELHTETGSRLVPLPGKEVSIGRSLENGLALEDDPAASRVHAAIRRIGASWSLRDLGSANGTFVNGKRLQGERALETGDEVLVGKTTLIFRSPDRPSGDRTESGPDRPELTPREKDVLIALCRPVLSAGPFTEPASVREISGALFITEAAVKQHLGHLYVKFGIKDEERRRTRLANEAFMRGSVSMADLDS